MTISKIQAQIESDGGLSRAEVKAQVAKLKLTTAQLHSVLGSLGYKSMPKSKDRALQMIADRLLAGRIAASRAEI
jgi:hypothetical protein